MDQHASCHMVQQSAIKALSSVYGNMKLKWEAAEALPAALSVVIKVMEPTTRTKDWHTDVRVPWTDLSLLALSMDVNFRLTIWIRWMDKIRRVGAGAWRRRRIDGQVRVWVEHLEQHLAPA